jgi:hypothetical protein
MLGRVMEHLSDDELGRLLTTRLGEAHRLHNPVGDCFCFYGAIIGRPAIESMNRRGKAFGIQEIYFNAVARITQPLRGLGEFVATNGEDCDRKDGVWYDMLCRRFGDVRIANAIRSRALRILAKRQGISGPIVRESAVGVTAEAPTP